MLPLTPARVIFVARSVTVGAAVLAVLGACGRAAYRPSPTVVRLEISGPINHMVPGANGRMQALAIFSDQSTSDVTTIATWSSSEPSVVTVSSSGEIHALAVGTVEIRASYAEVTAAKAVEVQSGS
jgi:hypothetical protein